MLRALLIQALFAAALLSTGCAAHLLPLEDGAPRRAAGNKVRIGQTILIAPIRFLTAPANNYSHSVYQMHDSLSTKCTITGAPVDEELRAMLATSLTKHIEATISAELMPIQPGPRDSKRGRDVRERGLRVQAGLLGFDCGSEISDGTVWLPLMLYAQRTAYSPISIELSISVIDGKTDRVLHSFTTVGEFEEALSEITFPLGIVRYRTNGGAPISEAFRQALDRAAEEIARWAESAPGVL